MLDYHASVACSQMCSLLPFIYSCEEIIIKTDQLISWWFGNLSQKVKIATLNEDPSSLTFSLRKDPFAT
jgi:hypothetical protein